MQEFESQRYRLYMRYTLLLMCLLASTVSNAQEPPNESVASDASESSKDKANDSKSISAKNSDSGSQSSDAWKWILGIVLTAIISPIVVKVVEKCLGHDPVKDKSQRLKTVIDLQAARKEQGLPLDGRLTALINELTDALGDEAKGKEQAIGEATSFIVGTLSSRLLEALFSSCQYLELLMDSKHRSNTFAAIFDLTRLEYLRSYYGQRRLGVPSRFTNINEADLDQYAQECERLGDDLGKNAIMYAIGLGTTPDDVENFVDQLKDEIQKAAQRDAEERGASGES